MEEEKKNQQKSISTALLGHRDKQSKLPTALALLGSALEAWAQLFGLLKLRAVGWQGLTGQGLQTQEMRRVSRVPWNPGKRSQRWMSDV